MDGIFLVFICFITVLICAMFIYVVRKIDKGVVITIQEKAREYKPVEDPFDEFGDIKDKKNQQVSMNDVFKEFHDFMTGDEDNGK